MDGPRDVRPVPAGVLTDSIQTTRRVERRQYEPAATREVRVQPSQEKPQGRQQRDDGLTARYEYVVVDGPEGQELARRQAAAILNILRCLAQQQGQYQGTSQDPRHMGTP